MSSACLIEIGTEELPPRALQALSRDFAASLEHSLRGLDLAPAAVELFATPRRLAVLFNEIALQQPDQLSEKRGPAITAAFDADGKPTRAALGFATSCGVGVAWLSSVTPALSRFATSPSTFAWASVIAWRDVSLPGSASIACLTARQIWPRSNARALAGILTT